ncbi:hypothetical protein LINGRAHAP2_LOCUS15325 [Linum grandiflorum]
MVLPTLCSMLGLVCRKKYMMVRCKSEFTD